MTIWKGFEVKAVEHRKSTVLLLDANRDIIDEISYTTFISTKALRELRHGRHRPTDPKDNRRSVDPASVAEGTDPDDDAFFPLTYSALRAFLSGIGPGGVVQANFFPVIIEPYLLKREGIVAGEIVAQRCWKVVFVDGEPRLRSVFQHDIWEPGEAMIGRGIGDWSNRGVHAWKMECITQATGYLMEHIIASEMNPDTFIMSSACMVTGTVLLWGDVVEHQYGYRAEFAKVRSLDWLYPSFEVAGQEKAILGYLQKIYGVSE